MHSIIFEIKSLNLFKVSKDHKHIYIYTHLNSSWLEIGESALSKYLKHCTEISKICELRNCDTAQRILAPVVFLGQRNSPFAGPNLDPWVLIPINHNNHLLHSREGHPT